MPFDKSNYEEHYIEFTKSAFKECLKNDIILKDEKVNLSHMGWFCLVFSYIPRNYNIIFENDRKSFSIKIIDSDDAYFFLNQLEKFDNELNEENIIYSIEELNAALKRKDIVFYKSMNDKLYKKLNGKYQRVKDIKKEFDN